MHSSSALISVVLVASTVAPALAAPMFHPVEARQEVQIAELVGGPLISAAASGIADAAEHIAPSAIAKAKSLLGNIHLRRDLSPSASGPETASIPEIIEQDVEHLFRRLAASDIRPFPDHFGPGPVILPRENAVTVEEPFPIKTPAEEIEGSLDHLLRRAGAPADPFAIALGKTLANSVVSALGSNAVSQGFSDLKNVTHGVVRRSDAPADSFALALGKTLASSVVSALGSNTVSQGFSDLKNVTHGVVRRSDAPADSLALALGKTLASSVVSALGSNAVSQGFSDLKNVTHGVVRRELSEVIARDMSLNELD